MQNTRVQDRYGKALHVVVATLCIGLSSGAANAQTVRLDALAPAAWLGGCWELSARGRVTHEQWMAPRGGLMTGMSRTVVRDTAREYEYLRLQVQSGRVVYVAHPSGQQETTFPATMLTDTLLMFNNPSHDFPQQISYRKVSIDSIVARIEGPQGGQVRSINFPMRRVRCAGEAP
jgi:Domain of unknown function (DUF6265)